MGVVTMPAQTGRVLISAARLGEGIGGERFYLHLCATYFTGFFRSSLLIQTDTSNKVSLVRECPAFLFTPWTTEHGIISLIGSFASS